MAENQNDMEAPLLVHLKELRDRLKLVFIAVAGGFIVCYIFRETLFRILTKPLYDVLPQGHLLVFTSLPEAFIVYIKIAFFTSFILTSPFIFFQIWKFISPGLREKEKGYIVPFIFFSTLLFVSGVLFCYFFALPPAFGFFIDFAGDSLRPMITFREYLSFTMKLMLGFGICFELPILIFFLTKMGVVNYQKLAKNRRYAILVICVVAALVTPSPDAFTQLIMALPMYLLYEFSVIMAWFSGRRSAKEQQNNEEA